MPTPYSVIPGLFTVCSSSAISRSRCDYPAPCRLFYLRPSSKIGFRANKIANFRTAFFRFSRLFAPISMNISSNDSGCCFAFPLTHEALRNQSHQGFSLPVCAYCYPVVEHRLIPPAANVVKRRKPLSSMWVTIKPTSSYARQRQLLDLYFPYGQQSCPTIKGDLINARFQRVYQNVATSCSSPLTALASHNCCSNSMSWTSSCCAAFALRRNHNPFRR